MFGVSLENFLRWAACPLIVLTTILSLPMRCDTCKLVRDMLDERFYGILIVTELIVIASYITFNVRLRSLHFGHFSVPYTFRTVRMHFLIFGAVLLNSIYISGIIYFEADGHPYITFFAMALLNLFILDLIRKSKFFPDYHRHSARY